MVSATVQLRGYFDKRKKQDPDEIRGPAFAFGEIVKFLRAKWRSYGERTTPCYRNWQPCAKVGSRGVVSLTHTKIASRVSCFVGL